MEEIRVVDSAITNPSCFTKQLADVVILTTNRKLLLQHRPTSWSGKVEAITLFGGHVEDGESALATALREVHEETGGTPSPTDLIKIGAVTEGSTNHTEIIHLFFWHDQDSTITGCYEAEPILFETTADVCANALVMPYAKWALEEVHRRQLIS